MRSGKHLLKAKAKPNHMNRAHTTREDKLQQYFIAHHGLVYMSTISVRREKLETKIMTLTQVVLDSRFTKKQTK